MPHHDAVASETEVRRRMRRQQFANTFVIMLFAFGIFTLSAVFIGRWQPWRHAAGPVSAAPSRPRPIPKPAPVATPVPALAASVLAPIAIVPTPDTARPPKAVSNLAPKPEKKPAPRTATRAPTVRESPMPDEAASPAPMESVFDFPGAGAAKRVLVGIKCMDAFAHEGAMHGRQFFSARCENGNRRSVSCLGGDCKIEYAPPPSHVP